MSGHLLFFFLIHNDFVLICDVNERSQLDVACLIFSVVAHRYDTFKLQRLQQKKLDRQVAMMEKEMFVGKESDYYYYLFIFQEHLSLPRT